MSFFDDASLVMIPSGYKDQKVYSVKPTDGTGDLTFSRASSATRVQSDGLIEKVRENLILQSQTFDNASWTKNAGATITANTTTAPDGTLTAETLNVATTIFSGLVQTFTTSTNSWTTSLFVKKGTKDFIYLFDPSTNRYAWFNLTTGAVGQKTASTEAAIISVGNGWFRVSVTAAVTGSASHFIQFGLSDADGSFTPASTGTAFIWGAQAEVSDFGATDYIATTTAAVSVGPVSGLPRLDYLGSTCPRLLLEPQRTNLVTFSEQFNNAAWTPTDASITANAAIAPDGTMSADKLVENSANQAHYVQSASGTYTAATYSMSVFAKASERNILQLLFNGSANVNAFANFDLTNGVVSLVASATASIEDYGNGWYRCTINAALSASTVPLAFCVIVNSLTATRAASYLGNGTSGLFVWGMQSELGAYATSYIPTLGASVTRVVDAASKTSASALIGQTEGTIFWEFAVDVSAAAGHESIINIDNGSFGNTIYIIKSTAGTIGAEMYVGGVAQASYTSSVQAAGTHKAAIGYANNNTAFFLNGVQIGTTDTSCSVPATSRIQLGSSVFGSSTDKTAQALLFKTRLTNAQLAELTA